MLINSPHTMTYWQSQQNAGFQKYPERTTGRQFDPRESRTVTIKSGQVLKARSFVQSEDASGKMLAGGNLSEYAKLVLSGTLANTDTAIAGGLTVTATGGVVTAAQVITALLTRANVGFAVVTGTLSGWEFVADPSSTATLWAYSTTSLTNVTNFAVTGTNTSLTETVTTVAGATTVKKPSGILAMDVDATSGDVVTTMYTEVYTYESEVIWGVDTAVDVVTLADGTTVACSAYNTGAVTPLLRQMYVENTKFKIVTPTAGEELA